MQVMVEVSLYPLADSYIEPIKQFIDRVNQYADIQVETNRTSTQITGDYDVVLTLLGKEMKRTHKEVGQAIFVTKFLNFDAMQKQ